jgi:hypothetical protein
MRLGGLILCAAIFWVGMGAAVAAPAQLYNKTIAVSWTSQGVYRDPSGQEKSSSGSHSYTVYVSTAGRLFERTSRTAGSKMGSRDNALGQFGGREARGLAFAGNTLVISRDFSGAGGSGAMRAVVSFDASFSSCSVSVTVGKDNGRAIKRVSLDGVVRTWVSSTNSGMSCSISAGNAFANG